MGVVGVVGMAVGGHGGYGGGSGYNNYKEYADTSIETRSKSDFWKTLKETLEAIVGQGAGQSVVLNSQAGVVVVRAMPQKLREVAEYLDITQNAVNRQVILEARILEVSLNSQFQSGINWQLAGLNIAGSPPPIDSMSMFVPVLRGKATAKDFEGVIELLRKQGTVQVLSSPRISTLNNQQAVIKVGEDQFFVTDFNNTTTTATAVTNQQNINLTPFFSGIALDVTPQISAQGEITLHIHPVISKVMQRTVEVQLGSSSRGQDRISLPTAASTVRETDSIVRAENGQIIVLGGLMQTEVMRKRNGVPIASSIPLIGKATQGITDEVIKSELVILLKPVVATKQAWKKELAKSRKNLDELYKEIKVDRRAYGEYAG